MMLQRTIRILKECREVWPLAARWVDALEKFSLNPQSAMLSHEGSMDDGKDPIPRAIRQLPPLFPTKSCSRQPGLPHPPVSLPEPNILPRPPGSQPELPPASSIESPRPHHPSNSISGLSILRIHRLPSPPPYNPQQQQPLSQHPTPPASIRSALMHPSASFPAHRPQSPSHTMQHAHNMYVPSQHTPPPLPPPSLARQSADGLGLLIDAFDSPRPTHPPHANTGPFNSQLAPGTDGFEGELQFYIDGPPATW